MILKVVTYMWRIIKINCTKKFNEWTKNSPVNRKLDNGKSYKHSIHNIPRKHPLVASMALLQNLYTLLKFSLSSNVYFTNVFFVESMCTYISLKMETSNTLLKIMFTCRHLAVISSMWVTIGNGSVWTEPNRETAVLAV